MSENQYKIAIAISSFRTSYEAMELVSRIATENWQCEYVLVVDSLGIGGFEEFIAAQGLSGRVLYFNSDVNLGSAGNLSRRLQWANELGMDYVLALNHDARITPAVYQALIDHAEARPNIGALYPLRYLEGKRIYDLSGKKIFSMTASGVSAKPAEELIEVFWSSSNGALYSMEPLRSSHKISPDASLWMGWEDYLYGLELKDAGYSQWIVTAAETIDNYEYKAVGFSPTGKIIADKPMWYGYYDARNLILIAMHRLHSPLLAVFLMFRVLLGLLLVPYKFKDDKKKAISFCLAGIWDGFKNNSGKWLLP